MTIDVEIIERYMKDKMSEQRVGVDKLNEE